MKSKSKGLAIGQRVRIVAADPRLAPFRGKLATVRGVSFDLGKAPQMYAIVVDGVDGMGWLPRRAIRAVKAAKIARRGAIARLASRRSYRRRHAG